MPTLIEPTDRVRLRSSTSVSTLSNIITVLTPGNQYETTSAASDVGVVGKWLTIPFGSLTGYASAQFFKLIAAPPDVPPVEPPTDPTEPETNPNPEVPSGETVAIEYFWAVVDGLKADNDKQRRYIETLEADTALLREIRLLLSRAAFDD